MFGSRPIDCWTKKYIVVFRLCFCFLTVLATQPQKHGKAYPLFGFTFMFLGFCLDLLFTSLGLCLVSIFRLLGSFSFVLLASVSLWIRYFRILGSVWFRLSLLLLGFSFGFGLFVSCFVFASPGLAIGFL